MQWRVRRKLNARYLYTRLEAVFSPTESATKLILKISVLLGGRAEVFGRLTIHRPMYSQLYRSNNAINDRTTGSIGQEQHSIHQWYRE